MKNTLLSIYLLVLVALSVPTPAQAQTYTVYAALYKENNIAIISPIQGKIIQRIQVGRGPDQMELNAAGTHLYVSNTGEYSVSVVDLATNTQSQMLRLPVNRRGITTGPIAATPDKSILFVAERAEKPEPLRVYVIDMAVGAQIGQFDIGTNANWMSVSDDGKKLFVVDKESGSIDVYDAKTYAKVGTVPLLKGLEKKVECITCSPAQAQAFITYGTGNKLQVVSTESYATEYTLDMPKYQTGFQRDVYVQPDGRFAFIINDKDDLRDVDGINVLDVGKKAIIKIFNAGHVPRGMYTAEGDRFFVASDYLKWYNMLTLEHLASVSLRTQIRGIIAMQKEN